MSRESLRVTVDNLSAGFLDFGNKGKAIPRDPTDYDLFAQ